METRFLEGPDAGEVVLLPEEGARAMEKYEWTPAEQKIIDDAMSRRADMGIERTPSRRKRDRRQQERTAARAKRRSSEVKVSFVCPVCGGPHSRADHPA